MPITSKFICLNGRFIKEEEFLIDANNRAFRYGDGFFETMHYSNGEVQLFDTHLVRMKKVFDLLKFESNIILHKNFIAKEIAHLANANHFFKGARVRMSFYRDGGGLYEPNSNKVNYVIENWALENEKYPLNRKGISIGLFNQVRKSKTETSFYKSLNTSVSILASLHKNEIQTDDCFLCNTENHIIESISSNSFFIKDKTIYTPSLNSACVHGVMRQFILKVLKSMDFELVDNAIIKENQLEYFDEIFLSNAVKGIEWVGAYNKKRYDNKITKQIHNSLLNHIFN